MSATPATSPAPPDVPVAYRLVDRVAETHDVATLWVAPVHGPPPPFEPAQFSMIGLPGLGDVPISISSPVSRRDAHGYTIRAAGAVTTALCAAEPGALVTIRGPIGRPWDLDVDGRHLVFVAGGIGIAPLRAAIHAALDGRDRYQRVTVLAGAIRPRDLVYRDWLERLVGDGVAQLAVDDPADEDGAWPHHVGFVTDLVEGAFSAGTAADTTAYVCGPDPMMAATISALAACGLAPERVQLTLERNMDCGFGTCGHCQLGTLIVCRDGPVVTADQLGGALSIGAL